MAQPAVSAFVTSVVRHFRDRDDVLQDVAVIESFDRWDSDRPVIVAKSLQRIREQLRECIDHKAAAPGATP